MGNKSSDATTLAAAVITGLFTLTSVIIGVVNQSLAPFVIAGCFALVMIIIGMVIKKGVFYISGIVLLIAAVVSAKDIGEDKWGDWSEWGTVPVEESATREVETRETSNYAMVVYVTQQDVAPDYYRNFRDFSIGGDFDSYGARASYGEKHFEIQVTQEQLDSATKYDSGKLIPNKNELYVGGYNKSSETAYVMPIALDSQGRYYPLFKKDTETITEYRYRDKIRSAD